MSLRKAGSELTRVNAAAGIEPVQVSADTWKVLDEALRLARLSEGSFDPTIGPLVAAWGIGTESPRVPAPEEIAALLKLVDYHRVRLDPDSRTVFLQDKGMALDLGGIAKGYAADEAARICRERGVQAAVLDLGGNIYTIGSKTLEDGSKRPWSIGLQKPGLERGTVLGILKSTDATLVTSGDYERFFEFEGKRYHHILDPHTGYPAQSGLVQTSIFSTRSSMTCDALSTALFVLGLDKGMELIETLPDYSALVVTDKQQMLASRSFPLADFDLQDPAYALKRVEPKIQSVQ